MIKEKRVQWLDTAKAIAIILVVFGHVIGGYTKKYNIPQYEELIEKALFIIYSFHMPLFFSLSGYAYALSKRREDWDSYKCFVKKKMSRLMIPYFIFSIIQIIIKLPLQGEIESSLSWKNIPLLIILPVDQFWYLYVLFVVSILYAFMDWKINDDRIITTLTMIFLACGIMIDILVPDTITKWLKIFIETLRYSLFFHLGVLLRRKRIMFTWVETLIGLGCFIFLVFMSSSINSDILFAFYKNTLMAITGIVTVTGFSMNCKWGGVQRFSTIGKETMAIYAIHVLLCAIIRRLLVKIGLTNFWISIVLGTILSVYIPIIVARLYRKLANRVKQQNV